MEKQVKELRLEIDELSQLAAKTELQSKKVDQSSSKLILAKAWLGKVMQELGVENPYKQDAKTKEEITPAQDIAKVDSDFPKEHLDQINYLRARIEKTIEKIIGLNNNKDSKDNKPVSREFAIARTNCYNYLCEAKFMLGFELARIKNS